MWSHQKGDTMKSNYGLSFKGNFRIELFAAIISLLIAGSVKAANYDDFSGVGIDSNKWEIIGTGFSQPGDGYLHFFYKGSEGHTLISKELYASGIFTMPFNDYKCNNSAPSGKGLGSIAGFGLGSRASNNWVRFERGQVYSGGYIEVNWVEPNESGHPIHVNWLPSEITAGFLQIRYDGTQVSFFYRIKDTDPWRPIVKTGRDGYPISKSPLMLTPGWGREVPMFINALPGGGKSDHYTLSFKVDKIDVGVPGAEQAN